VVSATVPRTIPTIPPGEMLGEGDSGGTTLEFPTEPEPEPVTEVAATAAAYGVKYASLGFAVRGAR